MTTYSVRKPFTVFVAVIIVLVIGAVSLTSMQTDLLPDMSLPYLMVITTDPGASPEKVEAEVTEPMEQSLGTVTGVENVTSVSAENYSMITLEFEKNTNMDSAMVKVSAKINQLELPETCGTPNMLEISMNMLATMYATVSYEKKDIYEISDFTEEVVKPYFERQEGVARVTDIGSVEKTIEVRLNEKKIDKINNKILKTTNKKLADAKKQIDDAAAQLADGKKKLEEAEEELKKQQSTLSDTKDATSAQLAEASLALDQAMATKAAYEANLTSLKASKAGLEAEKKAYEDNHVVEMYDQVNEAFESFQVMRPLALLAGVEVPRDVKDAVENPEKLLLFTEWLQGLDTGDIDEEQLEQLTPENLEKLYQIAAVRMPQIETGIQNLNTEIMVAQAAVSEIEKKMKKLDQKYKEASAGSFDAAVSFGSGDAQIASGLTGMESSKQEMEKAEAELKEAKKQYRQSKKAALENANIDRLANMDTLSQLIMAQDFSMPAGYIQGKNEKQWLLKVGDHYDSVEDLKDMLLCKLAGAGVIRLSDVADITIIDNAGESYARLNGQDSVLVSIYKGSTASTSDVSKTCKEAVRELEESYEGLTITPLMDQGQYIEMFISSIVQSMLFGALLAVIVLVMFFKDFKPTLIVAFSIPFSVLFAIVIMYFTGITINIMTLAGLGLAIGMLVDNSIVVIENIYRIRNMDVSAPRSAVQGAKQVAGPIIASTLTTICVFLPLIFTTGMVAELLVPFAMTITYSLVASLVVALTLVPTAASIVLIKTKQKTYPWFEKIQGIYGKILAFCLKVKLVPLALAGLLLVLCIYAVSRMGITMLPEMTGEQIEISYSVPEGTEKEDAFRLADQVLEAALNVEGVETVGGMDAQSSSSMIGGMLGAGDHTSFSFSIILEEDIHSIYTIRQITRELEAALAKLDGEATVSSSAMGDMSAMLGSGLTLNIYGDKVETLLEISEEMKSIVAEIKGFENISNGQEDGADEIHLNIDKDKAMKKGLTVAQIYAALTERLTTEKSSVTLSIGKTNMDVQIVDEMDRLNRSNLLQMEISADTIDAQGQTVTKKYKLGDFAELKYGKGVASISRANQSHYIQITADTMEGYNTTLLTRTLNKKLENYELPDGYRYHIAGESDQVNDMVTQMAKLMLLGFLLIYLVMVAQFQSLLSPFIVLFTIPLAFTGGLLGLLVAREQLSMMSLLGFTILMGTVVNNGIVFVDYTNQLRIGGMEKQAALIATGKTRMRPILMTALTTILSMSMMIFSEDAGNAMGRGMAIVVVGGLLYATLMTLFIVPVLYDILYRKQPHVVDLGSDDMDDILDDAAEFMLKN